jgi:O-antigen/teichoic acid export membrane protein
MSTSESDSLAAPVSSPASAPVSTRRALVFVYLGYIFRYLYMFIMVPFYGRVLGAAGYGRVLAGMSLFQVVWMVAEGGLMMMGARDMAAVAGDSDRRAALYGKHQAARALMLLPAALVGVAGTLISPLLREQPLFGILATLNGLLTAFGLGWYFQALLLFRTSVIVEMLSFVVSLPLILSLVSSPEDAWLVHFAFVMSTLVVTIVGHSIALRTLDWRAIRFGGAVGLLRESMTMFLYRSLATVTGNAPVYLYSLIGSATQVGYYGSAERIATVGLGLMQPASQVIFGTVSSRIAAAESEGDAYALMKKSAVVLGSSGLVMLVGAVLFAGFAVPLILGPEFIPVIPLLQTLGLLFPFEALNMVGAGFVMIPLRLDRQLTYISVLTATATVVLILGLGYAFAESGVTWARVCTSGLECAGILVVLRKRGVLSRIYKA